MGNMQNDNTDTIAAQATPYGRGGVSIVRVSGPRVKAMIAHLLECEILPRQASYLPFRDINREVIDEGIALFFKQPHSFTGEDVLELHAHGGPIIVDALLQTVIHLGARLARPGEFSERAFLNGKIDLAQAEAIADLIDASSIQAARSALRSLQGEFSTVIHRINEKMIHLRMHIEAAIDFSDEAINFLSDEKRQVALHEILADLQNVQQQAKQGSVLREGITVAIIGAPNVGKSSLLNCLSGHETAIVTAMPGTTRDILREMILIDGMPVHIIDTAGLRESQDVVEKEGIRRAHRVMAHADLIVCLLDATNVTADFDHLENNLIRLNTSLPDMKVIFVRNKIDLIKVNPSIEERNGKCFISLSAKSGTGIDLLKETIKKQAGLQSTVEGMYLARRRHLVALAEAHAYLEACVQQTFSLSSDELIAEALRLAQKALNQITGQFTSDDLLGEIFSHFCIGK